MKLKCKSTGRSKGILFFLTLMAAGLFSNSVAAQFAKRSKYIPHGSSMPTFYVGAEAVAGIRSFSLSSNIKQFNDINVIEQGQSVGLVAGGNALMVKVRHGSFRSSHSTSKEIDLKETTVSVNVSPLQFGQSKPKYFEPYVLLDLDVNNVSLSGTPLPKKAKLEKEPKHKCDEGGGLPPDPDGAQITNPAPGATSGPPNNPNQPVVDPDLAKDSELGKAYIGTIKAVRASAGLGLVCNIRGKQTFAKLFAEVKYGTSFKTTSTNLDLRGTKVSDQVTINFGVIMGVNTAMIGRR